MTRRILFALAGALLGGAAALALWWPLLALPALAAEGPGFFAAGRPGAFARTAKGAVLVGLLPALGVIHGAVIGAARGRLRGGAAVEVLAAPFAWVMTAGEGMVGGVVMVLSLVPGACVGMLIGLWVAGTPSGGTTWPDEAATGALLGVGMSLVVLNMYVQWPSLKAKAEPAAAAPAPPGIEEKAKTEEKVGAQKEAKKKKKRKKKG